MTRIFLLIALLSNMLHLAAQPTDMTIAPKAKEFFLKGQDLLVEYQYEKAQRHFQKALEIEPGYLRAKRGLAIANDLLAQFEEAAMLYDEILMTDPNYSRAIYFEAATSHFGSGNYQRALDLYEQFESLQETPIGEFSMYGELEQQNEINYLARIKEKIQSCVIAMDSLQFRHISEVSNLGSNVNTAADEYFPYLTNDQQLLFFTRRRNQFDDEDLYFSENLGIDWMPGSPVSSFNSPKNEGMATLVRNGRTLYFTACNREAVLGTCDIWEASLEGTTVRKRKALLGAANSDAWDSQASISCDGETLYFSSNREGGEGGADIWMSLREADGSWGAPINMGSTINTSGDEEAPFITNDGRVLYFSSTGHIGLGEQDIFMSRKNEEEEWGTPLNLGPPVNTSYRELGFFLSADGKNGYFASNREGGQGGMDIYQFELSSELYSDPITLIEITVVDSFTLAPIQTMIYTDNKNYQTDEEGRLFLCLPANEPFHFTILESEYYPYFQRIQVPEWDNVFLYGLTAFLNPKTPPKTRKEIEPPMIKGMAEQVTHSVFFDFNKSDMNLENVQELEFFLEKVIPMQAVLEVEIVGYSDQIGSNQYNMMLSEKRAKSVAIFLKNKGIRVDRVYIEGGGEISDNSIPDHLKRKVEIIFTLE
jgi:outer membrane protein OmpA-like peptidoglycan-associated protein/tetratricopeptide (TPR) repeat protein